MLRVVHQGQGLSLGLKPGDHHAGVHARLNDLQRHLAAHRLALLGHVDHAKAPFADLLQELVVADGLPRSLGDGEDSLSEQSVRDLQEFAVVVRDSSASTRRSEDRFGRRHPDTRHALPGGQCSMASRKRAFSSNG